MILLDGRNNRFIVLDIGTISDSTNVGKLIPGINAISMCNHKGNIYVGSSKKKALYLIDKDNPDSETEIFGLVGKFPGGTTSTSLTSNGTNILMLDGSRKRLFTLDLSDIPESSGELLISGLIPTAIAYHSGNLYLAGVRTNSLYLINPLDPASESGSYGIIGDFPSGITPTALGSNGTNLFVTDTRSRIYQVDITSPSDSTFIGNLPFSVNALDLDNE